MPNPDSPEGQLAQTAPADDAPKSEHAQNVEKLIDELRTAPAPTPTPTPAEKLAADIDNRFTYHAPKGDQTARYGKLRDVARLFAHAIAQNTPSSREQSLAITKLEECVFFANAAIARNE